jgi:hypothetical protein
MCISVAVALSLTMTSLATRSAVGGSITFQHTTATGNGEDIKNGDPFPIKIVNGRATIDLVNATKQTILDFHFQWTVDVGNVEGIDELLDKQKTKPYFASYTYTPGDRMFELDIYNKPVGMGAAGVGIGNGTDFQIALNGFKGVKSVMANATFKGGQGKLSALSNPEPASLVILSLGLAGVLSRLWFQRRSAPGAAGRVAPE